MEDAHLCELNIGNEISLFGVFDGHGGKEVADYCAGRFHEILLKLLKDESWKGPEKSLDEAFLKVGCLLSPCAFPSSSKPEPLSSWMEK